MRDLKKEARGGRDARKGGQAKECGLPLEAQKGKEKDFSLEPPEGTSPANTLTLAQRDWLWTFSSRTGFGLLVPEL